LDRFIEPATNIVYIYNIEAEYIKIYNENKAHRS